MKTSLTLLDELEIAEPCPVSWEQMTGNERVRHCRECNQKVFDLSCLTTQEGIRLIEGEGGSVCVRLYRRTDGRVIARDCASVRALRCLDRVMGRCAAAIASLVVFAFAMVGCGLDSRESQESASEPGETWVLMGKVACGPSANRQDVRNRAEPDDK